MATEIKAHHIDAGYQTILSNGRHSVLGDEPVKSNGTDLGLSPSELVLAGLAMCKTATVRYIARKNGWKVTDVKASLSQQVKGGSFGLEVSVKVQIEIRGDITEEQRASLLHEADKCYIHKLLSSEWKIENANVTLPSVHE
jgi:putative redox protein